MKIILVLMPLLLVSCGHHRDVRPGTRGLHRVVVASQDSHQGKQEAIAQANHYCDQFEKHAAFAKESTKYVGSVDEKTYQRARMFSRATKSGGNQAKLNGGKKESSLGVIAGAAGSSIDEALGNGYQIDMIFKCI